MAREAIIWEVNRYDLHGVAHYQLVVSYTDEPNSVQEVRISHDSIYGAPADGDPCGGGSERCHRGAQEDLANEFRQDRRGANPAGRPSLEERTCEELSLQNDQARVPTQVRRGQLCPMESRSGAPMVVKRPRPSGRARRAGH